MWGIVGDGPPEAGVVGVKKAGASERETWIARRACAEYLERTLLGWRRGGVLRPLAESRETQVYVARVKPGLQVVVKRQVDERAFRRELTAVMMFERIDASPRLVAEPDYGRGIVAMEYVPRHFFVRRRSDLEHVAKLVGTMHGFASLCQRGLEERTGVLGPRLVDVAGQGEPYGSIGAGMMDALGGEYRPVAIGDLKQDHVRLGRRGCVLVDLETFHWGGLEAMDLFQLSAIQVEDCEEDIGSRSVAASYCRARKAVQDWPVCSEQVEAWIQAARWHWAG